MLTRTGMVLIVLSLFSLETSALCGPGCLSCKKIGFSDPKCVLCDSQNNFYMKDGICTLSPLKNCSLLQFDGKCILCDKGHYKELITDTCQSVPISNSIEKCEFYEHLNRCSVCQPNYYFEASEHKCKLVDTLIENCDSYLSATECLKCKQDFWVSYNRTKCFAGEAKNCRVHSVLRCGKCVNKFFKSNNYALVNPGQSFGQMLWAGFLAFETNPLVNFSQWACVRQVDENCDVFDTNFTCFKCKEGFFLYELDRRCYLKPKKSVQNCLYYQTDINCNECEEGFHREQATKCTQNKILEFCTKYSTTSSVSSCLKCKDGYWADQVNHLCQPRDKSKQINFCQTYSDTLDDCKECIFGYHLTSDSLRCLNKINNCFEYQVSNLETETFNCYVCNEGYYLDLVSKTCVQPAEFFTSKCKIYARTSDKCEECLDKTFIQSVSLCASHDEAVVAPQCASISKLTKNLCDTCAEGYFKFQAENSCIKLTKLIEPCLQYENQDDCAVCKQGFWGKKCDVIPVEEFCLEKNFTNGQCLVCVKKYFLDKTTKKCQKPLPIEEEGCHDLELDNGVFTCNECKENMLSMKYEYSYFCDKPSFKIPDNCVKMKMNTKAKPTDPDTGSCVSCMPGYYLKEQTCLKQCNFEGFNVKIQDFVLSGNDLINKGRAACSAVSNELLNCALETFTITNQNKALKKVCSKCKLGMAQVIEVSMLKYAHTLTVNETLEFTTHHMTRFPALTCKPSSDVYALVQTGSAKEGCKYFYGVDAFTCLKCIDGMSGALKKFSETVTAPETCDKPVTNCSSSYNMKGANYRSQSTQVLEGIFSCSHCDGDKIPFYHAVSTEAGIYIPTAYRMDLTIPGEAVSETTGLMVECRSPILPSDWDTETTIVKSYEGTCGLGVAMVDKDKTVSDFLRCVSCAPGFKAEYDTSQTDSIKVCSKIDNCDTTFGFKWFNACSKCTSGFLYLFDKDKKVVEYHTCISKSQGTLGQYASNCFSGHPDNGCFVCEEGYTLNEDKICEVIGSYDCASGFVDNIYPIGTFDIDATYFDFTLPFIYDFNGKGCQKCNSPDHVAFYVDSTPRFYCTPRTYIAFNTFIVGSNFVKNCLRYKGGNDGFKCITCREQFVVVEDNTECVSKTGDLANCIAVKASNNAHCKTCGTGFLVFQNKCSAESIKFCKLHTVDGTGVICSTCDDGYVLSGDSKWCDKGGVDNCQSYGGGGAEDCTACQEGYALFADRNSAKRCLQMLDSHCKTWKSSAMAAYKYECDVCENGFGPNLDKTRSDFRPNMCFGPVLVKNCIAYGFTLTPNLSAYECSKCEPSHYLSTGFCNQRTVIDVYCLEYQETGDKCSRCTNETILSTDKTKCMGRPTGVANCDAYSDLTTCHVCIDNFFLANNTCAVVPDPMDGCVQYTSAFECKSCADQYYMDINKKCLASTADNCLTFRNATECEKCAIGTILGDKEVTDGEGVTTTIQACVLEEVVPNCDVQDKKLDAAGKVEYFCKVCAMNYFMSLEGCQPVTVSILDCLYYSSVTECLYCSKGKIGSEDRKSCMNPEMVLGKGHVPDYSCDHNRVSQAPICTLCNPGYVSDETSCVACNVGANCIKCDPFVKSRCTVCKPGFWMNDKFECLSNTEYEADGTKIAKMEIVSEGNEGADSSESQGVEIHSVNLGLWLAIGITLLKLRN